MYPTKEEIISAAKEYLKHNEFLEMNHFVNDTMNCPEPHGNTNFIGDIAYKLRNTGKYEVKESGTRYMVYKKERKSWKERFWWLLLIIGYIIGVITPIVTTSIEKKIWPNTTQSQPTTPTGKDTSQKQ